MILLLLLDLRSKGTGFVDGSHHDTVSHNEENSVKNKIDTDSQLGEALANWVLG